jgi:hypothetical protein
MPVAQSPAHYINSSKGCSSISEYFLLVVFLVLCATVVALPVVQPHCEKSFSSWLEVVVVKKVSFSVSLSLSISVSLSVRFSVCFSVCLIIN